MFEVGYSKNYNDLVQDARRWLEGQETVVLVIIAKFEKMPPYKNPMQDLSETEFAQLNFPKSLTVKEGDFNLQGDYGPVTYKGHIGQGRYHQRHLRSGSETQ